jgi:adenosylcobyric acid synthase
VTRLTVGRDFDGQRVCGYEIRHGEVLAEAGWQPWLDFEPLGHGVLSARDPAGNVLGTTLHGLFGEDGFRTGFLTRLAARRGVEWQPAGASYASARERQVDRIADACEQYLDLDRIWGLVESAGPDGRR